MKRLIKIAEKYSAFAEDLKVPFGYYILTFLAFVTLRNLLEVFSDKSVVSMELHFHYYLSYICLALFMTLLFSVFTGEKMARIARLVLCSFYFIFLAPILDLVISGGQGYNMAYLLPDRHGDLLLRYLTLGGPFEQVGITIGLKLEVSILMISSFVYSKAKKVTTLKSLLLALLVYTLIFAYAIVPFVVKAILDVFHLFDYFYSMLFAKFYLVVIFVLLLIVVRRWNKKYFTSLVKDMRPYRQAHALMMFAFGIILGPSLVWNQDTFFDLPLVAISIFWACLFVIMTNNLEDQNIDRWVNRKRPLVSGAIPRGDYKSITVAVGLLALTYALAVSYYTFFTILLFMGLYSLYSMPPIRFKRVPFFSKLVITINSLAFVIMGYAFAGGEVIEFSPLIILWFLIFFTAAMNFIDLKDYQGDKRAGIKTLPVLWGMEKSQRVIGLFFALAYVAAPFAVGQMILLIPAIGAGVAQYWLVNKKDYQEKWVFGLYLASFTILLVVLGLAERLVL
ncbi:MAG: hypothetical protein DRJ03_15970 [Chloroflexi bacterium]|nr:MAG: hypothetical protein DRI81_07575 [Chloroflexota bacterium]RLC83832.1 MAG: hypothetical protein DRJ03_15970 [Chloroflexota bacterium]